MISGRDQFEQCISDEGVDEIKTGDESVKLKVADENLTFEVFERKQKYHDDGFGSDLIQLSFSFHSIAYHCISFLILSYMLAWYSFSFSFFFLKNESYFPYIGSELENYNSRD